MQQIFWNCTDLRLFYFWIRSSPKMPAQRGGKKRTSCDNCFRSKIKCDMQPVCEPCRRKGKECFYPTADKVKTPDSAQNVSFDIPVLDISERAQNLTGENNWFIHDPELKIQFLKRFDVLLKNSPRPCLPPNYMIRLIHSDPLILDAALSIGSLHSYPDIIPDKKIARNISITYFQKAEKDLENKGTKFEDGIGLIVFFAAAVEQRITDLHRYRDKLKHWMASFDSLPTPTEDTQLHFDNCARINSYWTMMQLEILSAAAVNDVPHIPPIPQFMPLPVSEEDMILKSGGYGTHTFCKITSDDSVYIFTPLDVDLRQAYTILHLILARGMELRRLPMDEAYSMREKSLEAALDDWLSIFKTLPPFDQTLKSFVWRYFVHCEFLFTYMTLYLKRLGDMNAIIRCKLLGMANEMAMIINMCVFKLLIDFQKVPPHMGIVIGQACIVLAVIIDSNPPESIDSARQSLSLLLSVLEHWYESGCVHAVCVEIVHQKLQDLGIQRDTLESHLDWTEHQFVHRLILS
ncbi:hypothetical protein EDD86DRAFT_207940 [Gorgonomyces haynaldii]|nr:hypothetical protein EDD86DRAFT_207940 [Gorgonomyces haynaldii]